MFNMKPEVDYSYRQQPDVPGFRMGPNGSVDPNFDVNSLFQAGGPILRLRRAGTHERCDE
jgi:hypothetical protein